MIEDLWYKNAIIYNIDLDMFQDTTGDGVGDFEGLMRRLDYLQALGVDAIWLAPFQPTPNRDHGYDISDFYGIDERHGSSGDFVEFTHQAKKRGIKVMIDLVINHTSDQHPWFRKARSDSGSRFRDWYVWADQPQSSTAGGTVFPGKEESTWTFDEAAGRYYFHRFFDFQPDLNMDNPVLRTELRRVMGYWLELGIAGFRMDAVPFVLESEITDGSPPEQRFDVLAEFRQFLQWRQGDAILLGEANVSPEENRRYFGTAGDGLHMMFNFFVNQHLFLALATGDVQPLIDALRATRVESSTAHWANFLRNHDELDLARLGQADRERLFRAFAPEERMQIFGRGIRRRLAPMLQGDRRRIEFANSLLFALPGTPVLRYGDEIGMGEDLDLEGRESVRTPMQWSDEPQGGFSTAEDTVVPVIDQGAYGYQHVNVERQRRDPNSLLNWFTRMIRLRKECPEIGWGHWEVLDTGSDSVLGLRYDWRGVSLLTLHNFTDEPREVHFRPGVKGDERLIDLVVEAQSVAGDDGAHSMTLQPYDYRWFRVGSLNYLMDRERVD